MTAAGSPQVVRRVIPIRSPSWTATAGVRVTGVGTATASKGPRSSRKASVSPCRRKNLIFTAAGHPITSTVKRRAVEKAGRRRRPHEIDIGAQVRGRIVARVGRDVGADLESLSGGGGRHERGDKREEGTQHPGTKHGHLRTCRYAIWIPLNGRHDMIRSLATSAPERRKNPRTRRICELFVQRPDRHRGNRPGVRHPLMLRRRGHRPPPFRPRRSLRLGLRCTASTPPT